MVLLPLGHKKRLVRLGRPGTHCSQSFELHQRWDPTPATASFEGPAECIACRAAATLGPPPRNFTGHLLRFWSRAICFVNTRSASQIHLLRLAMGIPSVFLFLGDFPGGDRV